MTRIAYCANMSPEARQLSEERGDLNVYRVLANAGDAFTGWMIAGRATLTSPVLPVKLRELIILRIGYLLRSPYEIAQHTALAEHVGVGDTQRAALEPDADLADGGFDRTELAVLELATEMITTKTATADTIRVLRELIGDEALIEALLVVSRWSGLALMLNALDVDLDTDARFTPPHR
jgi:4-carboxymuconolactone decarboxylase